MDIVNSIDLQVSFNFMTNDFKDSDYFESTYDVEDNLHAREEKPSILGQISKFKSEEEKDKNQEKSEKGQER